MENKKYNYNLIIIGILVLGIVGMIIFWPSNLSEFDKEEIERLHKENTELLNNIDSLNTEHIKKDSIISKANAEIITLTVSKDSLGTVIQNINKRRNETRDHVANLDDNDVVNGITDYIKRNRR